MVHKNKFVSIFYKTLRTLLLECNLGLYKDGCIQLISNKKVLLESKKDILTTTLNSFSDRVFEKPSALMDEDEFLSKEILVEMLKSLKKTRNFIRLNHIGFCYAVDSMPLYQDKLKREIRKTRFKLYSLESNDFSRWYFIGDVSNWREPMLEFLPVPSNTKDKEIDYWLPGIHINIDTDMFYDQIFNSSNKVLKGMRRIRPIISDGNITQVRIWIGVIGGVNLHLDLGTTAQNTRYVRKVMLEKLE